MWRRGVQENRFFISFYTVAGGGRTNVQNIMDLINCELVTQTDC
jgi:hypothetical protein